LCEADCPGLTKAKGSGGKTQNNDGAGQTHKTSAWAELDKLKF
jgi:hypothetical protein